MKTVSEYTIRTAYRHIDTPIDRELDKAVRKYIRKALNISHEKYIMAVERKQNSYVIDIASIVSMDIEKISEFANNFVINFI